MAYIKVKYDSEEIYIDDEIKDEEKGISIRKAEKEELENTKEIDFSKINNLEDTFIIEDDGADDE